MPPSFFHTLFFIVFFLFYRQTRLDKPLHKRSQTGDTEGTNLSESSGNFSGTTDTMLMYFTRRPHKIIILLETMKWKSLQSCLCNRNTNILSCSICYSAAENVIHATLPPSPLWCRVLFGWRGSSRASVNRTSWDSCMFSLIHIHPPPSLLARASNHFTVL